MRLTKREARARMQLIQEWHMNKAKQRNLDKNVRECGLSYVKVYRARRAMREADSAVNRAITALQVMASTTLRQFTEAIQRIVEGVRA